MNLGDLCKTWNNIRHVRYILSRSWNFAQIDKIVDKTGDLKFLSIF